MKNYLLSLACISLLVSCNSEDNQSKDKDGAIEAVGSDTTNHVSTKILIKASPDKVWDVITKPEYAIALGANFDRDSYVQSDWTLGAHVYFKYLPDSTISDGLITKLEPHKYIQIDYDFDGFKYEEIFTLIKNDSSTELAVNCGPYTADLEAQKKVWKYWLKSVKAIAENKRPYWRRLNCGLYQSPDGEIGFPTDPAIANVPREAIHSERCQCAFLTYIGYQQVASLSSVLDTATFESLGASFFKDKNHIYNYYAMCEGGYLNVFSDDTTSFEVLGDCYARYKDQIYHHRNGSIDADLETFKSMGCVAKDKNGYFEFEERVDREVLINRMGEELFEKLEAL